MLTKKVINTISGCHVIEYIIILIYFCFQFMQLEWWQMSLESLLPNMFFYFGPLSHVHQNGEREWMDAERKRCLEAEGKREWGLEGWNVQRLNAPWMLWDITNASGSLQITPPGTTGALHRWKTPWLIERGQRRGALLHLAAYTWWMNGGREGWRGGAVPCWAHGEQGPTRDLLLELRMVVMGGNGW